MGRLVLCVQYVGAMCCRNPPEDVAERGMAEGIASARMRNPRLTSFDLTCAKCMVDSGAMCAWLVASSCCVSSGHTPEMVWPTTTSEATPSWMGWLQFPPTHTVGSVDWVSCTAMSYSRTWSASTSPAASAWLQRTQRGRPLAASTTRTGAIFRIIAC